MKPEIAVKLVEVLETLNRNKKLFGCGCDVDRNSSYTVNTVNFTEISMCY